MAERLDEQLAVADPGRSATVTVVQPVDQKAIETRTVRPADRRGRLTSPPSSGSSTATSPADAMRLDELGRTRVFLKVAIATCAAAFAGAFVVGGDPIARYVVFAGCVVTSIGALGMLHALRSPAAYSTSRMLPFVVVIAFGAFAGVYYWGVASPVAAMIAFGIYFFSLGGSLRLTTAIYVLVALLHGLLGLAIIAGVLVDRGIINLTGLPTIHRVGVLVVVESLYFITFITARLSQRVTLDAVSQLEKAVRGIAQGNALLAEARAELDRARMIGGPGRFTEQVVGSFRLGVLIGRGGMGEVYEAHGVGDQREAAVKLIDASVRGEQTQVQRFLREAEIASRLDCPHVVRVLEVGTTGGELPFLAMERLRGYDLAEQLRRERRMSLSDAAVMANHVAIGLEAARAAGIVHRDLKPHNVFLSITPTGQRWKILDFGVSKAGGSGTLTQGMVVGTPAFMAPEQARGESVDHRADVYSLAAILYRAVTGNPLFVAKDVPVLLYEVVYRVPALPSWLAAIPEDVDRVLAIGLAKHARDRFATAAELALWFEIAIANKLSPDQRRRADELIAKFPWGTRLDGA